MYVRKTGWWENRLWKPCQEEYSSLTGVEALGDGGGINQVASTQAARDVLVDVSHLHRVLDKYR